MKKLSTAIKGGFNRIILMLTASDILVWGTYSVVLPIISLYLETKFGENTVEYVGIGLAVYYLTRGLAQLPIGIFTDKIKHDIDEILLLFLGSLLMALPFFIYPAIYEPWHYVALQFLGGLGASLNLNSWRKLFAKNLTKGHEGMNYGFYETIMSFGTAALSLSGGLIANISTQFFEYFLLGVGFLQILGGITAGMIYFIRNRKSYKV